MYHALLAQALSLFGLNIFALIGYLIGLVLFLILLVVTWTGLSIWFFHARQRKSMQEYHRRTRRVDGKMYPPITGGICDQCGRIQKVVYHLPTGPKLCKDCYEPYWRQAEGWVDPSAAPGSGAEHQPRAESEEHG